MIEEGCRPPAVVIAVTSAVVVVFPWVPAIPTALVAAHNDPNMPDRWHVGIPLRRASINSTLAAGIAVEKVTTSAP
jgi:hypothetical protein